MNLQESIRRILREVFDSKSTFKRNVYGGEEEYREITKNRTVIWNPQYNIAFQYIFDDQEVPGYTFIHLYPYTEDGYYYRWDILEDSIKSKIFVDALKKLPKVLKNYFKKFGEVDIIVFRPKTEQMGNIYSSPSVIRHLESEFGTNYDIEVNTEETSHLPVNTVIMRLKNEGEPINESIRRILREELNNRSDCNIMYVPEQLSKLDRFSNLWDMVVNDIDELEETFQLEKELLPKDITVYSVQKNFDTEYIKRMDDERYDKSDISLFKYKNKLYIIDGHHRLCYDRINNRDSHVYIFDKDDSEFVDCIFYGIGDC